MIMCTRIWPLAAKRLDDGRCHEILARWGTEADRKGFERAVRSTTAPDIPEPEKQTTAVGGDWLAMLESIPSGYRSIRSQGHNSYQIQLPQGQAAMEAGRRQLPVLINADTRRQVGVCTAQDDGSALIRFSKSAGGVEAEKSFAQGQLAGELAFLSQGTAAPVPAALSLRTVLSDSYRKENSMSDHLEIAALGARHNKAALANSAIAAGKSLDEFRSELLEELSNLPIGSYGPDYLAPVERSFSLTRLIHAEVTNDWSRAGYEREMCQEAARSYKGKARGLIVPASALASRASMNMAGTAAGSVGETLLGDAYIDALRPASSVMAAGATMFPGLGSNVAIPKNTGDVTASWVAEGASITESDIDVATIDLTPKMIAGRASFTRHLLATSTPKIDELVRRGLTQQIANAIDLAALEGSGTAPVPRGVANTVGVNALTTAGATLTWAEALEAMADVAAANLDSGSGVWIMHPLDAAKVAQTSVDSGSGRFVLENGTIAGRRVIESSHATEGQLYFGLWQHAYIGMWSGLDLIIDPYTNASTGIVNIVASQLADVAVAHPTAFTVVTLGA